MPRDTILTDTEGSLMAMAIQAALSPNLSKKWKKRSYKRLLRMTDNPYVRRVIEDCFMRRPTEEFVGLKRWYDSLTDVHAAPPCRCK